jgi:hypothetical protein
LAPRGKDPSYTEKENRRKRPRASDEAIVSEDPDGQYNRLLEMLSSVRVVLRTESTGRRGKPRIRWQQEQADEPAGQLYRSLVVPLYYLGPTPQNA